MKGLPAERRPGNRLPRGLPGENSPPAVPLYLPRRPIQGGTVSQGPRPIFRTSRHWAQRLPPAISPTSLSSADWHWTLRQLRVYSLFGCVCDSFVYAHQRTFAVSSLIPLHSRLQSMGTDILPNFTPTLPTPDAGIMAIVSVETRMHGKEFRGPRLKGGLVKCNVSLPRLCIVLNRSVDVSEKILPREKEH